MSSEVQVIRHSSPTSQLFKIIPINSDIFDNMASLALFAEKNISYFTALWPRSQSAFKEPGKTYFDHAHPRTFASRLEKSDLDKDTVAQILRAEAACANGLEGLPIFAAAVIAGNSAGLSPLTLNALSVGYIASRIVYNYVYIFLGATAI
ncbi:hypothetical protein RRF57_012460 [Xylaria bambusicola]|uniref:Uncharacterized protein n=1 Tax=Xylaria bambusicola TaxID=326684 RepID=A0AAN7UWI3_9PEZI